MQGAITTLLNNTKTRLYPNFFDVVITSDKEQESTPQATPGNSTSTPQTPITTAYSGINGKCFSADFGGDFSTDMEYNDNTKQHFIKKANSIKTVTLTFYESHDMLCIKAFKKDMESIYDFTGHYFKENAYPNRTITISIDDTTKVNGLKIMGNIKLYKAKLSNYKYPKFSWKDKEPIEVSATFSFDKLELVGP